MPDQDSPLFSFSFNAEVLSFLGGQVESDTNGVRSPLQQELPTKPIVAFPLGQIIYFQDFKSDSTFGRIISVIRYSAVTTGILIVVGLGSFCGYTCLQRLRNMKTGTFSNPRKLWDLLKIKLKSQCFQRSPCQDIEITNGNENSFNPNETLSQKLNYLLSKNRSQSREETDEERGTNAKWRISFRNDVEHIFIPTDENGEEIQTEYFGPALEKNEIRTWQILGR